LRQIAPRHLRLKVDPVDGVLEIVDDKRGKLLFLQLQPQQVVPLLLHLHGPGRLHLRFQLRSGKHEALIFVLRNAWPWRFGQAHSLRVSSGRRGERAAPSSRIA
jgi:hypothetical protein